MGNPLTQGRDPYDAERLDFHHPPWDMHNLLLFTYYLDMQASIPRSGLRHATEPNRANLLVLRQRTLHLKKFVQLLSRGDIGLWKQLWLHSPETLRCNMTLAFK